MSDGQRPGGLTALAVLNFVFGGLGAIGLLALFALLGAAESATGGQFSTEVSKQPGSGLVMLNLALALATVVLLIVSGIGYLGLKRMLGRTMGNMYALVSLASSGLGIMVSGFGFGTIIGLIYPVLTLALINGTFKDDLVR